MKPDRFLAAILIGIALLGILAVVFYFVRQGGGAYSNDTSPQGVVQNYLLALNRNDFSRAYQYLAQRSQMPSQTQFQQYFLSFYTNLSDFSVQVGATYISGDQASVVLVLIQTGSSPFGSSSRLQQPASLVRQEGEWKILQMPYPFWDYSWGQEVPAGKPPPQQTVPVVPATP